ncbi:hypothetical protein [Modestobacter versicolor]|uniref:Hemagglutinin n=1 Tax=Modestobacter versicolor TaxID=429133 RepID=A0A323VF02_9ACTN|nr:hypothetical protein [Modestobacter versicolor]MBB3678233.1 hypothetical protein [Modestobacter versicolor]PZA23199.1 hypothetical protein DMO24_01165 [Modestobacter versicolor]
MTRLVIRLVAGLLGLVALSGLVLVADSPAPLVDVTPAADTGQFTPGNIISDAVFFDGDGMSVDDVRAFIELKGMNCKAGADGTPCLKDFRQDTTARAADSFCTGYGAGVAEPAALIIAKAALSCNISPKVLLVMLQKEQSLVTNSGSSLYARRYREAMGYACPDTAPCDPAYNGFQNQVYSAARRFQVYKANPTSYGYRAGRTQDILFQANKPECGSSPVYIQNQATAGLYVYTPYQPNAAALRAGYGTGDACSAYGNRNFWLYFTDWFGSTQAPGESPWQPVGALDQVSARTGDSVDVRGWTVDPDTAEPIDVHVYVDGQPRSSTRADVARADVAAALPAWGAGHGFQLTVPVTQGVRQVCVYAINVAKGANNPVLGCMTVDTRGLPVGSVERAVVTEGQGVLRGWALDPDTAAPLDVHVYVNGTWTAKAVAGDDRPDVGAVYPAAGPAHGWSVTVPLRPGQNQVCVYAINVGSGAKNPELACRLVDLQVVPQGDVQVTGGASAASISGWALDPETAAPVDVHLYVDGQWATALTADRERPDVAAAFTGLGVRHGFATSLALAPGPHQVCAYAINVRQGTANPQIGCGSALVGVPAVGNLEQVTATRASVRVKGWALDPDTAAPVDVHIYVDGAFHSVLRADADRPDVGAAYPAAGAGHGFDTALVLAPGRHSICAFAINVLGGTTGNPPLGCRDVTVPASVAPQGSLDAVDVSAGHAVARGWVYDPDVPTTPIAVHFYVDGAWAGQLLAEEPRPDVAAAVPGAGELHGFTAYLPVSPGRHTVCAYGIDTAGGTNPSLGCAVVTR